MSADGSNVTFIMPAYNQGEFVREAIESVFKQTAPVARLIVVNDGSTDNTDQTMHQLVREHPTITYLNQANAGVCAACNTALALVETSLVIRLDADDRMPENYVEALLHCLEGQPETVGYAYCDAQYFGAREGWMHAGEWSLGRMVPENFVHVASLVRVSAARQVGYFNKNMTKGFEDWDFYLSLAEAGFKGAYCRETFLWYRQKNDGGRNDMTTETHKQVRAQIAANHPRTYGNPLNKARIFSWRAKRKIRHLLG